jgi:ABC-type enterobactin transport system permease subunit
MRPGRKYSPKHRKITRRQVVVTLLLLLALVAAGFWALGSGPVATMTDVIWTFPVGD